MCEQCIFLQSGPFACVHNIMLPHTYCIYGTDTCPHALYMSWYCRMHMKFTFIHACAILHLHVIRTQYAYTVH